MKYLKLYNFSCTNLCCSANPDQYNVDPYNSTIYRFTSTSKTPSIFLQQYKLPELPCLNMYSNNEEENEKPPTTTTTDSEKENSTLTEEEGEWNNLLEPTLHLVKPITLTSTKGNFIAGVSGIELSHKYLKGLVMDVTTNAETESEFNCAKNNTKLWCYFMDLSGYILASNQDEVDVKVGNFLGVEDPSLMRHLIEKDYFDERPEYNYAALCENAIECNGEINAASPSHVSYILSLPMNFLISFLQSSVSFLYQLNITALR